ncbi:MAG: transketolase [Alphaproteobacteria bacterium]|nr:transketolase [Alphaproteobacteria bacterium]
MTTNKDMANALRFLAVDGIQRANSGHPGMPMGMADVATVLFRQFIKINPSEPKWIDRDRFVLSAGHGSMLLYGLLHLTGFEDVTIEQLKNFRQLGSITAGHPEYGHVSGVDMTTGPLGQGIATAVGMAIAEKMLQDRYSKEIIDHYTYVMCGDGCLMEGISQEAISLAGHLKLNKMIVLWDDNSITIDGSTDVSTSDDHLKRFEASGWNACRIDGHNPAEIADAIKKAQSSNKPTLIACKTIIGFGSPNLAGTAKTHGSPLGDDEIAEMRKNLGWDSAPFEVPKDIVNAWREIGAKGAEVYAEWQKRLEAMPNKDEFKRAINGELPENWKASLEEFKKKVSEEKPKIATRKASQDVLEVIVPAISELIGGSADLTGSNLTKTKDMKAITAKDFSGRYIHYGVREHGMAAAMNGMALHGGFIPYSGCFMVFVDYLRPSLRLSAMMGLRVIYVLTHDSIGVGEDGPTHQPVEQIASIRAIPNVLVFRPCDVIETAECWELAVENKDCPSVLALTRQALPLLRSAGENKSAYGGYVLKEADGERQVTIMATGSEVETAVKAREMLAEKGVKAAVVSMPCLELFDKQPKEYKDKVLGKNTVRIAVEALSSYGWEKYTGLDGAVIGMKGFGASAPADKLFEHFGITAEAVVNAAMARI